MRTIVKELVARGGKRKVQFFHREDGSFGFEIQRFSEDPRERYWIQYGQFFECFAIDEQTAEFEARSRLDINVFRGVMGLPGEEKPKSAPPAPKRRRRRR